jgi:hypothetical protein
MTAQLTTENVDPLTAAIRVSVPERGLRQDLRAVRIVWYRELIRFSSDRLRAATSLVQPVLFLFVLGTGRSSLAGPARGLQPPAGVARGGVVPGAERHRDRRVPEDRVVQGTFRKR